MSIFVSVASYRDPQLVPTVQDCLDKARHPERLRFGICWQHGDDEVLPDWFGGDQFAVVDVDYRESRGSCWARAQLVDLWDDADWFLQLDSHHRFVPGWDEVLHQEYAAAESDQPVITTYAPPFELGEEPPVWQDPMSMLFRGFNSNGMPMFMPQPIADWRQRTRPRRARFLSGHFHFAQRQFLRDVPSDPEIYFGGEEIDLAVRAFTHGYDLFEPSRLVMWHEYGRAYRRKHWDDHLGDGGPAWHERDAETKRHIRTLFDEPHVGRYGFGAARTLEDYERYAGISFRHRKVQDHTRRNHEPPGPPLPDDWPTRVLARRLAVDFELPAASRDGLWALTIHDASGEELHRHHVVPEDLEQPGHLRLEVDLESLEPPTTWRLLLPDGSTSTEGAVDDAMVDLFTRRPTRVRGLVWTAEGERFVATVPGDKRRLELNSSGALLVELADGTRSVREIAAELRVEHDLDDDPSYAILELYESALTAGLVELDRGSGPG